MTTHQAGGSAEAFDPSVRSAAQELFAAYLDTDTTMPHDVRDEAFSPDGTPDPAYVPALEELARLGVEELGNRMQGMADMAAEAGMTVRQTGEDEHKPYPIDFVPRIISAEEWEMLSAGLRQRALALNAFLDDIYGERRIVAAGILTDDDLRRAPGYDPEVGGAHGGKVHAHVTGVDLVRDDTGNWVVIEDNLRVPAGVAFAVAERRAMEQVFPELTDRYRLVDPKAALPMLRETMLAAGPADGPAEPRLGMLSQGPSDSVFFEHELIAEALGAPIVTPSELAVEDGVLCYRNDSGSGQLDAVFARITQAELFEATGYDGEVLGPRLLEAMRAGTLTLANAFGNGAGDDKAIYPYVPEMIQFYLDEEPILAQVDTKLCHLPKSCAEVLDRLGELVVKPIDGQGGAGITIGPDESEEALAEQAEKIRANPDGFIAQEVVKISTLPTFDGASFVPRHVDMRAMVQLRETDGEVTAHVVPACLTRTAPEGSLVVNASKGGGGKDTWILRAEGK